MYETYVTESQAICLEDANRCFSELSQIAESTDETLKELYSDFVYACLRYAKIRSEWAFLTKEQKLETDSSRTSAHNSVINTHNILARYMTGIGRSTEWYTILSYNEADKMSRKRIGDFACYIALFLGLQAR